MYLLRLYRQGLLERRRRSKSFEYCITDRGESRLVYLWKKLGYLNVDRKLTYDEEKIVRTRLRKVSQIYDKQIAMIDARKVSLDRELIKAYQRNLDEGSIHTVVTNKDLGATTKLNRRVSKQGSLRRLIEQAKSAK